MTLKEELDEARVSHDWGMLKRAEVEAECKEVSIPNNDGSLLTRLFFSTATSILFLFCVQMEAEIVKLNQVQVSIRNETDPLKQSADELKDQIYNLSTELHELQAEKRQLSEEIVLSRGRIKVELADAVERLEQMKVHIVEKQSKMSMFQKQFMETSTAEESLRKIITNLPEMEKMKAHLKMAAKDLGEAQNMLHGMKHTKAKLLEDVARFEAKKKLAEDLRSQVKLAKKSTEEEVLGKISSFHKFEKNYWARKER